MRLIIISNRLPLTITRQNDNFVYKESSGGLVTGLKAVKSTLPFMWLGNTSGLVLTEDEKAQIVKDCWEMNKSIPVFITKELNELAYDGFCNGIAWPLLHSFSDDATFSNVYFKAYREYNKKFCERVVETVKDGDIVWVHDYHLMLLPDMLRKNTQKKIKIGFFLHTPFPVQEIFCTLPCARDIIKGIMGSDHIAFHSHDYLAHFLRTCRVLFPTENDVCQNGNSKTINYSGEQVNVGDREIRMKCIPIGIDPSIFRECLKKSETKARIIELKKQFAGKKIILGVDRTDYIKGIPNRMKGLKRFLNKHKDENVVYLQVGVPSRMEVPEYKSLVKTYNQMVTEINSTTGKIEDNFVFMHNSSVKFEELCALYAVSSGCLITSLQDGMNLVALEYIACQENNLGVLILSENAGCASTLPGAVFCNPWNQETIADAIQKVIMMSDEEKMERYTINSGNVDRFTAMEWAKDNVDSLKCGTEKSEITI